MSAIRLDSPFQKWMTSKLYILGRFICLFGFHHYTWKNIPHFLTKQPGMEGNNLVQTAVVCKRCNIRFEEYD